MVVDPIRNVANTFGVAYSNSSFTTDPGLSFLMWGSAIAKMGVEGIDDAKNVQLNALKEVLLQATEGAGRALGRRSGG